MATVVLPYTLTDGQPADATQVMADLNAIVNQVNGGIDSTNIAGTPNFPAAATLGTAITNNYLKLFSQHNIVYNPWLYGSNSTTVYNWNLNTNASATYNDSTVANGLNSISDANAADLWVINQTIGTALNTSSIQSDVVLQQNKQYCVWASVKTAQGGNTVHLVVQNASSYSGGNTDISSTIVYHTGDGTEQKIYSVFTVPASCNNITIGLVRAGNTTSVKVSEVGMCLGSLPVATESDDHVLASGLRSIDNQVTKNFNITKVNNLQNQTAFSLLPTLVSSFSATAGTWYSTGVYLTFTTTGEPIYLSAMLNISVTATNANPVLGILLDPSTTTAGSVTTGTLIAENINQNIGIGGAFYQLAANSVSTPSAGSHTYLLVAGISANNSNIILQSPYSLNAIQFKNG